MSYTVEKWHFEKGLTRFIIQITDEISSMKYSQNVIITSYGI